MKIADFQIMGNRSNRRKALISIAALIFVMHSAAQDKISHVTPEVNKAFTGQFPMGRLKKWEKSKDGYIAIFRQKGKKCVAYYSASGNWEATETSVKWTRNLPGPVRAGWNSCKSMSWLILDMKEIEKPGQTLYAIHVGQVQSLGPDDADIGSEYILFFSVTGELVKEDRVS